MEIIYRTRVFSEFWEKYDSNPIKKFGHFCVVTKNKKIEIAIPFQLLVFPMIPILIINKSSFQCTKCAISSELCYLFSKSVK